MDNSKLEFYWNDIPIGKSAAVTYSVLTMWWGVNDREARRILHKLSYYDSGDNYILIRSGKSKGFYRTDNIDEIKLYKKECLNKGLSMLAPIKKINRIFAENAEQYTVDNNLRVYRENAGMTQSEVVKFVNRFDSHFDAQILSKMENGYILPTAFQLALIAECYQCDTTDLINADLYF